MARNLDSTQILTKARKAFYGVPSVSLHKRMGISFERESNGTLRVTVPPGPETVGLDGEQSTCAVYTLGEVACGLHACEALWPWAVERGMIPMVLTVSARFWARGPAHGTLKAQTELVDDLDQVFGGAMQIKKTTVEVVAKILGEDGELAAEHRVAFYARFLDEDRARAMASASDIELSFGVADLMRR
jgi:hypothetical protein